MCVCVVRSYLCECVLSRAISLLVHIYAYVRVCVSVCVCAYVLATHSVHSRMRAISNINHNI